MVLLDWPPPDHLGIGRKSRQFQPAQTSCRDPGTESRAAPPTVAAQTRIVSKARIRWIPANLCDLSRGVDISEFESYMPSQAVGSPSPSISKRLKSLCPRWDRKGRLKRANRRHYPVLVDQLHGDRAHRR